LFGSAANNFCSSPGSYSSDEDWSDEDGKIGKEHGGEEGCEMEVENERYIKEQMFNCWNKVEQGPS
jgi:hypothetical protein